MFIFFFILDITLNKKINCVILIHIYIYFFIYLFIYLLLLFLLLTIIKTRWVGWYFFCLGLYGVRDPISSSSGLLWCATSAVAARCSHQSSESLQVITAATTDCCTSATVDNLGGKPLHFSINDMVEKTCAALRPH